MLAMAAGGYLYFKHSQNVIESLVADKARLEGAVATQQETIEAQRSAAERQNQATFALQQQIADAERSRRDLEMILRRRNLETMARNNSADLEQRINRATATIFRDLEILTAPGDRPSRPAGSSDVTQPATPTSQPAPAAPSGGTSLPTNFQPPPRPPVRSGATSP